MNDIVVNSQLGMWILIALGGLCFFAGVLIGYLLRMAHKRGSKK